MVMATMTEAPEMFGAACNIVGICNMQTFLERTKDYRRKLREAEQLEAKMKKLGKPVEMLVFPDEGTVSARRTTASNSRSA